jgi:hypothetical protein
VSLVLPLLNTRAPANNKLEGEDDALATSTAEQPALDQEERILSDFSKEVGYMVENSDCQDEEMTVGDASSAVSTAVEGANSFLKTLSVNIDRLHMLSPSLSLILSGIIGMEARYQSISKSRS